jgi:excisionase family DNA binding protein
MSAQQTIDMQKVAPSTAARRLGVSVSMVRVWMENGRLPCERTQLGRLIPASAVEDLIRERAAKAQEV